MLNCPYCKVSNTDDKNFCSSCYKQIRCRIAECRGPLEFNAPMCFICGCEVGGANSTTMNRFSRSVVQRGNNYTEKTEISATDASVATMGQLFFGTSTKTREIRNVVQRPSVSNNLLGIEQLVQDESTQDDISESNFGNSNSSNEAFRLFTKNGDFLHKRIASFKGKTSKEEQINFILLYTWGYPIHFNDSPSYENIRDAADKHKIYDKSNFKRYFDEINKAYFINLSEKYLLNSAAEKKIDELISVLNDNSVKEFGESEKKPASGKKRPRISKEDPKVLAWTREEVGLGKIDVTSLSTGLDFALLSLWIITTHLEKTKSVRPGEAYRFLKSKYDTIDATSNSVLKALQSKGELNQECFGETEGAYFLKPKGKSLVERWIKDGYSKPQK
jgi:hypothetical protein